MPDQHAPDTEARILEAAHRVFLRKGTAGTRMVDIAEEAGVNQALLHYYFRSKERLATAVFIKAASRFLPTLAGLVGADMPLPDKVEAIVHAYIDIVRERPFIPPYLFAELHHHPERLIQVLEKALPAPPAAIVGGMVQHLQLQIDAEVAAGRMRPIAAAQLLVNVLGLCVFPFIARPMLAVGLAMDDVAFARFLDERREELPGFILRGLAA